MAQKKSAADEDPGLFGASPDIIRDYNNLKPSTTGKEVFHDLRQYVNEATGEVKFPEGISKAFLIFTLDARKLQRIDMMSIYDPIHKKIYGEWISEQDRKLKRYTITKNTTILNFSNEKDRNLWKLLCIHPTIIGSTNEQFPTCFRIEIPELNVRKALKENKEIANAILYINQFTSIEQFNDLATLMNLEGYVSLNEDDRMLTIQRIAMENPKAIMDAAELENAEDILFIRKAIESNVIRNVKGVYKFADFELGTTVEQAVFFINQENNLFMKQLLNGAMRPKNVDNRTDEQKTVFVPPAKKAAAKKATPKKTAKKKVVVKKTDTKPDPNFNKEEF
jgi:hypothetical protein